MSGSGLPYTRVWFYTCLLMTSLAGKALKLGHIQGWPGPYIYRYIRCTYDFLAGKSPYIRSYTVQIYSSGQP